MAFDRKAYARVYYREYRKRPERQAYERKWRLEHNWAKGVFGQCPHVKERANAA